MSAADHSCMCVYVPSSQVRGYTLIPLKALAHYKDFHKDFSEKIVVKSLSIDKTVEKIVAVVKKSCSVRGP